MTETYGFDLIEEREIPELNAAGRLYRHQKTGTELLSMQNDDENKVFCMVFKTPPEDSSGVAHILEHSVLNGSEKYPVKEPFVELFKGSLQTFVNAFTFSDKTCYPCASQNLQDFYNLVEVYVDAVLHPLLRPHTLDQEGWHLNLEDIGGELAYKGVVFNEMKGAYSDPENVLGRYCEQSLFPDNTYRHDSGGAPRAIPDLTYPQFKAFWERCYHPSNARIFWYGDDPLEERLRRTAEYLEGYDRLEVDAAVDLQKPFKAPEKITKPYAADDGNAKCYLAVNWALAEQTDPELTLGLNILNHILIGSPASPLRKALIDSGLGEDLVGGGTDPHLRQMTFTTGLKGIAEADAPKVETLIDETLGALVEKGIDPGMVAASMNTIEFQLRENNTGQFPRGLSLLLRATTTWLYGNDPFAPLAFEAPLNEIKRKLGEGQRYFEDLIETYFIDNPHRTAVLLTPDMGLNQREAEEEKTRLAGIRSGMNAAELQTVVEHTNKLKQIQETPDSPEALATLPALTLDDLDKENKRLPIEELEEGGVPVLYHDLFTNGIAYLDVGFDLHSLPQEYLPYLGLFAQGLVKMGTESEDFVRLAQRIGRETGGIYPSTLVSTIRHTRDTAAWLLLRGKSTVDKAGEMLTILKDVLLTTKWDNRERFRQIAMERKARMESSLVPSGHRVVSSRLKMSQSEAGWLKETFSGVENLFFTRRLLEEIESDWGSVVQKFETMRGLLVDSSAMLCNVTLDAANWAELRPQLGAFIREMPGSGSKKHAWEPAYSDQNEGLTIPAQVNYVGKGANLYELGYSLHGSIGVINNYMGATYMWEKIRVQGGAYGGFSTFDSNSGIFNFVSYRDPNLLASLDKYDAAADFLKNIQLSDGELVKAIIGGIANMDGHLLPDAKGYTSMTRRLTGYSDEERQRIRDEVLNTTAADFKAFGKALEAVAAEGRVVVLGSADEIETANQEREGFLAVKKVL